MEHSPRTPIEWAKSFPTRTPRDYDRAITDIETQCDLLISYANHLKTERGALNRGNTRNDITALADLLTTHNITVEQVRDMLGLSPKLDEFLDDSAMSVISDDDRLSQAGPDKKKGATLDNYRDFFAAIDAGYEHRFIKWEGRGNARGFPISMDNLMEAFNDWAITNNLTCQASRSPLGKVAKDAGVIKKGDLYVFLATPLKTWVKHALGKK